MRVQIWEILSHDRPSDRISTSRPYSTYAIFGLGRRERPRPAQGPEHRQASQKSPPLYLSHAPHPYLSPLTILACNSKCLLGVGTQKGWFEMRGHVGFDNITLEF